jgi:hypothetical protein
LELIIVMENTRASIIDKTSGFGDDTTIAAPALGVNGSENVRDQTLTMGPLGDEVPGKEYERNDRWKTSIVWNGLIYIYKIK